MGYDLHTTRGEDWSESGHDIKGRMTRLHRQGCRPFACCKHWPVLHEVERQVQIPGCLAGLAPRKHLNQESR